MIYHYTSLEVLHKIIAGVEPSIGKPVNSMDEVYLTLHATSAYFLNDWTESQLVPNVLRDLNIPIPTIDTALGVLGQPFVLSFSGDGDSFPMWKMYGNDGKGVALGFDEETIKKGFKTSCPDFIGDCVYIDEDSLKEVILRDSLYQQYKKDNSNAITVLKILFNAMKYKHIGFEYENEYRIIVSRQTDEEYITKDNAIIPYIRIPILLESLRSITIGPLLDKELTQYSIRNMLFRYLEGYPEYYTTKPLFLKSTVPYRMQ